MNLISTSLLLLSSSWALATPSSLIEHNILEERGCATGIATARAVQVKNAFSEAKIVPRLIPSIDPKLDLTFSYGGKKIDLGKPTVNTLQTLVEPLITISGLEGQQNRAYSVFLIDPDVPNQAGTPFRTPYLHWYFAHVKASGCKKSEPETVTLYQPPTPSNSTELHSYTFLVFEEPARYTPKVITAQLRLDFKVSDYVKGTGLKLVGGNYFLEDLSL